MVVAGKLEDLAINPNELIEYKILATQARGQEYSVEGAYNGSEVRCQKVIFSNERYSIWSS